MANPGPATTNTPQSEAVMAPVNTPQNSMLQGAQAFRLLGVAYAVNLNALGDTAITINNATSYSVFQVVMAGATISLTTAFGGVFTAPAAGGTALVANAALSGLTGPTIVSQRTVASTTRRTEQTIYFNVGTAQGAPATANVYVYGFDLSDPT